MTVVLPAWGLEGSVASVSLIDHSHSSFLILRDNPQGLLGNDPFGSSTHGVSVSGAILDIGVEEMIGLVRFQPLDKETEFSFVSSGRGQGDLMSPPTSFNGVAGRVNWSGPSLGSTHDNHWPPRLGDGFTGSCCGLDLFDLFESPFHRSGHIVVDVDVVFIVRSTLG